MLGKVLFYGLLYFVAVGLIDMFFIFKKWAMVSFIWPFPIFFAKV